MELTIKKAALSLPMAAIAFLFGDLSALFWSLVAAVALDYVSGVAKAVCLRELSSEVMFTGGLKKLGVFFAVMAANIIDNALQIEIALRSVTICYYIVNEALSVLENAAATGVPLPEALTGALAQLRGGKGGGNAS
ncbi:MAG: phage holin family protein [Clostridiales bacterium]|nr:phage holin family protein [Clostridiales bacterium]